MTPEQFQQIVQEALGYQPPWYLTVLLACIVAAVVAWVGPYLGERAKLRALQSEVQNLVEQARQTTRATEDIKSQISATMWLEQSRWSLKRDVYCRLLEALGEFIWCQRFVLRDSQSSAALDSIHAMYREVVRAHSSGRVFLSPRSFELIALFSERLEALCAPTQDRTDNYAKASEIAWNAFNLLAEEASQDLMALRLPESPS